ncbi:hypothetical protein SDJN03_02898, partial [Cucurbita argyrosperma subsp. sororia]
MGETNRWKVTYTKHLKQKRKVYHDGFLGIHLSSNKIDTQMMLYDECAKLLECRLLKQDEVIYSRETLIFNRYLVDTDASQGDHKLESEFKKSRLCYGSPQTSPDTRITEETEDSEVCKYGKRMKRKQSIESYKDQLNCLANMDQFYLKYL